MYKYLSDILNHFFNKLFLKIFGVTYGANLEINGRIFIRNKGKISLGNDVKINSGMNFNPIGCETTTRLIAYQGGEIKIGDNVGISNSIFISRSQIQIEDNVLIGNGCKFWDTDFHSLNIIDRYSNDETDIRSSPIRIKKNAFIGGCAILLKGVTIGENSIIGAGSVVTKNVPNNQIWAGNPAKFIKNIN